MDDKKILVWFKNDLRLSDNETWFRASKEGTQVTPMYIFDPRQFKKQELGFPKTGVFRAQYLLESVAALQNELREKGSDLLIFNGFPELIIPEFALKHGYASVFAAEEVTNEELSITEKLEKELNKTNVSLRLFWTSTLIHFEDIPWPIQRLPDTFTQFRKEVERESEVRPLFELPVLRTAEQGEAEQLPTLEDLGLTDLNTDARTVITYRGGEAEARKRLNEYLWEKDLLRQYKETRNGLIGSDYSSKFSLALAHGCISAKTIYYEVKKYESARIQNDSTYWLVFELLWRDYFRFVAKKYGSKIFQLSGIRESAHVWKINKKWFEKWRLGETGVRFIDANMKELLHTGFMSNRGRQNVASYLTKDLKINWTWGASWFESQLIDYDPCSNWLNWAYVAGVGNDPREDRYFKIESQVKKYDPRGVYINQWLVPTDFKTPV